MCTINFLYRIEIGLYATIINYYIKMHYYKQLNTYILIEFKIIKHIQNKNNLFIFVLCNYI